MSDTQLETKEEKAQEIAFKISKDTKRVETMNGYLLYEGENKVVTEDNSAIFGIDSLCTGATYRYQLGQTKDGRIVQFGSNEGGYNIANFSGDRTRGFHIIDLPYEQCLGVKQYAAQHRSNYVLMNNGDLYVWGYNGYGMLGTGNTTNQLIPVRTATGVDEIFIPEVEGHHGASVHAVYRKGVSYFFAGRNPGDRFCPGQTADNITSWTAMVMPGNVKKFWNLGDYCGAMFVQTTDNSLYAIGYNGYGALGIGNATADIKTWTLVKTLSGTPIKHISTSSGYRDNNGANAYTQSHTTFLTETGEVYTCGDNTWGQLGLGVSTGTDVTSPTKVTLPKKIKALYYNGPGVRTTYAHAEDNTLYAWGYNTYGQCGTGNTTQQTAPYFHNIKFSHIYPCTAGYSNSYVRPALFKKVSDGRYYALGYGGYDPCGRNSKANMTTFTLVNTYQDFKFIKVNSQVNNANNVFFVKDNGEMYCTGSNDYAVTKGIFIDTEIDNNRGLRRMC